MARTPTGAVTGSTHYKYAAEAGLVTPQRRATASSEAVAGRVLLGPTPLGCKYLTHGPISVAEHGRQIGPFTGRISQSINELDLVIWRFFQALPKSAG